MIFGKRTNQEAAQIQRERLIDYKVTFGTPQGKAVLYDILDRFHVLNSHKGDPYLEGQRSVALHILNQCHIDLVRFDEMLKGTNE